VLSRGILVYKGVGFLLVSVKKKLGWFINYAVRLSVGDGARRDPPKRTPEKGKGKRKLSKVGSESNYHTQTGD
jgi:hypothetical protein